MRADRTLGKLLAHPMKWDGVKRISSHSSCCSGGLSLQYLAGRLMIFDNDYHDDNLELFAMGPVQFS